MKLLIANIRPRLKDDEVKQMLTQFGQVANIKHELKGKINNASTFFVNPTKTIRSLNITRNKIE